MNQPEIIYSLETMTENRNEVLKIFKKLKGKFLTGKFTLNNLIRDYNYSLGAANLIIETLARNGMINGSITQNNTVVYSFENDKKRQIENIGLWLKRSRQEMEFFDLAIQVINKEIENSTNIKSI